MNISAAVPSKREIELQNRIDEQQKTIEKLTRIAQRVQNIESKSAALQDKIYEIEIKSVDTLIDILDYIFNGLGYYCRRDKEKK